MEAIHVEDQADQLRAVAVNADHRLPHIPRWRRASHGIEHARHQRLDRSATLNKALRAYEEFGVSRRPRGPGVGRRKSSSATNTLRPSK